MTIGASPAASAEATLTTSLSKRQRRFLVQLTAAIAGGMFIDGFVLGSIGIVMPAITEDLNLSLSWQGLIGASALIGIFLGGPLGGLLADKIGRRPMFTIDLGIFIAGSCAQFFVENAWQLFLVRLLMGIAIGADYAIGWPLLAEFAPARLRGKLLCIQDIGWRGGFVVAYALGYVLTISTSANWNIILGLSVVPSLVVFLMRLGTPESARWLMSKGRSAEAEAVANQYMDDDERRDMRAATLHPKQGFGQLFSRDCRNATLFISVFWICNVTPYFAIGTFVPVVLQQLGIKEGLGGGLAFNVIAILGTLFSTMLVEKVGRRKLVIPPLWISTIAFTILGLFPHQSSILIVTCALIFAFANAVSGTMTAVYSGEVFPTEIRGAGVGFATSMSRVGAAAGTFLLPTSMAALGVSTTMLFAAGISLIGAIVSQLLAPETMGKPLSQTSASSRKAEHNR